jgi:peptidyl-tRNA hydrolase, PTH1 family
VKLVVGLGNPGARYADTRHNAGVQVLEHFARAHGIVFDQQRFQSRLGIGRVERWREAPSPEAAEPLDVALLAPQTFMNRAGAAVTAAVAELAVGPLSEDLLVVFDDVDLPFGRLRLRRAGGAGGHRGLADVIEQLGRSDFPRLRFGVGRPSAGQPTTDHVLERFTDAEGAALPALLERAALALGAALRSGLPAAMNEFNRDPARASAGSDADD